MKATGYTLTALAVLGALALGLYAGDRIGSSREVRAVLDRLQPVLDENADRIIGLERQINDLERQVTEARRLMTETGFATYYGYECAGRPTASGEIFDPKGMTAASWRWPFGTRLRVTSLDTGRSVTVRNNDRGPHPRIVRTGVIIDLAQGAAEELGMVKDGRHRVMVTPELEQAEGD